MPEIGALLHDAVPPDGSEPDLDEIAYLAARRRRRRRTARIVLPLAAVAIVASGLFVLGSDEHHPDLDDDTVVVDEGTTTTTTSSGPTGLGAPSPTSFAMRLGTRPLTLTTRFASWPLIPEEFFGQFPPDQAVVGTLVQVRPGAVLPDSICNSPISDACTDAEVLETVVQVERWLGPGGGDPGPLTIPWLLGAVPVGSSDAEAIDANQRASVPYGEAAPHGARVLVLLTAHDEGPYAWAPSAVSAIVIEDGDGVAVPHATQFFQPIDFDDYVARVEELLQQQG